MPTYFLTALLFLSFQRRDVLLQRPMASQLRVRNLEDAICASDNIHTKTIEIVVLTLRFWCCWSMSFLALYGPTNGLFFFSSSIARCEYLIGFS